ncbi:protein [Escherichia coli]|nr:protein [Escherichia coli]
MELYKEYPAWLIFLRRTCAVAGGRSGAAFHAFLERPRPLL